MALAMEVADTGGEIGKKLNPLKRLVDSITNIFAQVNETMEALGLPGRGNQKQVEGPRKQLPSPETTKSTSDL